MDKSEKLFLWLLIAIFGAFALFVWGYMSIQEYLSPSPKKILSRMERRDPAAAQEMIDHYSEDLKTVAAAAEILEDGEWCFYPLNYIVGSYNSDWYEENVLHKIPEELLDVLRSMEEKYPECKKDLEMRKGQVGIGLMNDSKGFSILCYPGGSLMSYSKINNEEGTRCLDMGDGWELQMYYAPKG
ncbi:hypothetical protein N510_003370 [Firmicutes bacterium ASF500]|nr:hypothetical protein N510_003370 [Firmicutes bacterium ASF500]